MKKFLLIVLAVFTTVSLFAQVEKGRVTFSADGNFTKTTSQNGVTSNQTVAQVKEMTLGTSIGFFLTDRFVAGVGLNYLWNKENRLATTSMQKFLHVESMWLQTKAFAPYIYLGYYYPVANRLYFNSNLNLSYGKAKSKYRSQILGMVYDSDDGYTTTTSNDDSNPDLFSVEILPELTYFISSKIGLSLGLGGIGYSIVDWESDKSGWLVNFNPTYWELGLKLNL